MTQIAKAKTVYLVEVLPSADVKLPEQFRKTYSLLTVITTTHGLAILAAENLVKERGWTLPDDFYKCCHQLSKTTLLEQCQPYPIRIRRLTVDPPMPMVEVTSRASLEFWAEETRTQPDSKQKLNRERRLRAMAQRREMANGHEN